MLKRYLFPVLLLLACSGAPTGERSAEAVRAALEAYEAAWAAEDWFALYSSVARESLDGQTPEEFATQQTRGATGLARAIQRRSRSEIIDVRIEGEHATASVQMQVPDLRGVFTPSGRPSPKAVEAVPLREVERKIELVWERGGWKVIRPAARAAAPEVREQMRLRLREEADRAAERMGQAQDDP